MGEVLIKLDIGDQGTTLVVPERHWGLELPALAEFAFDTWQRGRPWSLETYFDYVAEFDDTPLPGPDQIATDWYEQVVFYHRLRISPDGRIAATLDFEPGSAVTPFAVRSLSRLTSWARRALDRTADAIDEQCTSSDAAMQVGDWHARRSEVLRRIARCTATPGFGRSSSHAAFVDAANTAPTGKRYRELTAQDWVPIGFDLPAGAWTQTPTPTAEPRRETKRLFLLAELAPGSTVVTACDRHQYAGFSVGHLVSKIGGLERHASLNPIILTCPDTPADIVLQTSWDPDHAGDDLAGWIEHNPIEGSRYWLYAPTHHDVDPAGPVRRHLKQRLAVLSSRGWSPATLPRVSGPLQVTAEQRLTSYAAAATAVVLSTALTFHSRDSIAAALDRSIPTDPVQLADGRVDALVWQWSLTHAAAERGIDGAAEHRKRIERALATVDIGLASQYWRRMALTAPADAMTQAAESRIGARIGSAHRQRAVGERLTALADLAGTDLVALLGRHRELAAQSQRPTPAGVVAVPLPDGMVDDERPESLLERLAAGQPLPRTSPLLPGDEPGQCWFAIETGDRSWAAYAQRGSFGLWDGYLVVPPGHDLHGCDRGDPRLPALSTPDGIAFAGPAADRALTGRARNGPTWLIGLEYHHGHDPAPPGGTRGRPERGGLTGVRDWLGALAAAIDRADGPATITAWPGRRWHQAPAALTGPERSHPTPNRPAFAAPHRDRQRDRADSHSAGAGRGRHG